MKSRLYWKILFGFWLTFILMHFGSWYIYLEFWPRPSYERFQAEKIAPVRLGAAKAALEQGGFAALERLLAALPGEQRALLRVDSGGGAASSPDTSTADAVAPDGSRWRLTYLLPPDPAEQWKITDLFYFSRDMIIVGVLGGLTFSAVLAWYLTIPVRRIRRGLERLAGGDLTARLQPVMGRRGDEIADLAKDFDRMAERLQQLMVMRDQLLHDVSHELRSPLARLSQAVGLLQQDPDNAAASIDRIQTEVRRVDELVGELLSLSAAESGETRERYFDLPQLVETVVSNVRYEAVAKGVAVKVTANLDEGIMRGSAELMRRALENVLRNALQVSGKMEGIEVALNVERERREFVLTVADEGPGAPPLKLEEMFEPFVRLEGSSRKGYGLGLAIARRAVLALGGSIDARNRPTRGLLVTIRCPLSEALFEAPAEVG